MIQDVTAAIICKENTILIARRAHGRHAGKWEFPGGKVEDGESPEACLQRELHEEFGVKARTTSFFMESLFEYGFGTIRLLAYFTELPEAPLRPVDHDQVDWAPISLLTTYDLLPADIPIAEALINQGA